MTKACCVYIMKFVVENLMWLSWLDSKNLFLGHCGTLNNVWFAVKCNERITDGFSFYLSILRGCFVLLFHSRYEDKHNETKILRFLKFSLSTINIQSSIKWQIKKSYISQAQVVIVRGFKSIINLVMKKNSSIFLYYVYTMTIYSIFKKKKSATYKQNKIQ